VVAATAMDTRAVTVSLEPKIFVVIATRAVGNGFVFVLRARNVGGLFHYDRSDGLRAFGAGCPCTFIAPSGLRVSATSNTFCDALGVVCRYLQ
jgi:hypothetical protein